MRILLDECSGSLTLMGILAKDGHDVVRVQDTIGIGQSDRSIVAFATRENRVVITMNCGDFIELSHRPHSGMLLNYKGATAREVMSDEDIARAVRNVELMHPDGLSNTLLSLVQYLW